MEGTTNIDIRVPNRNIAAVTATSGSLLVVSAMIRPSSPTEPIAADPASAIKNR